MIASKPLVANLLNTSRQFLYPLDQPSQLFGVNRVPCRIPRFDMARGGRSKRLGNVRVSRGQAATSRLSNERNARDRVSLRGSEQRGIIP
jgi:hypothetical protein